MNQVTVKYIDNGYTVVGAVPETGVESHYAATLEEAVFWVDQMLAAPAAESAPQAKKKKSSKAEAAPESESQWEPELRLASEDPLANQEAIVMTMTTGGFLVRQMANSAIPTRRESYEAQCYSMDDVANVLAQVYTAPPPPEQRANQFTASRLPS
jgi:hypothetical protein